MLPESQRNMTKDFLTDEELTLLVLLERNLDNGAVLEALCEIAQEQELDFVRVRRAAEILRLESLTQWSSEPTV